MGAVVHCCDGFGLAGTGSLSRSTLFSELFQAPDLRLFDDGGILCALRARPCRSRCADHRHGNGVVVNLDIEDGAHDQIWDLLHTGSIPPLGPSTTRRECPGVASFGQRVFDDSGRVTQVDIVTDSGTDPWVRTKIPTSMRPRTRDWPPNPNKRDRGILRLREEGDGPRFTFSSPKIRSIAAVAMTNEATPRRRLRRQVPSTDRCARGSDLRYTKHPAESSQRRHASCSRNPR